MTDRLLAELIIASDALVAVILLNVAHRLGVNTASNDRHAIALRHNTESNERLIEFLKRLPPSDPDPDPMEFCA